MTDASSRIELCGPFVARDSKGREIAVRCVDMAAQSHTADFQANLVQPNAGLLYVDEAFCACVREQLKASGYAGAGCETAESGMQCNDFVLFEPKPAFAAFARSKGWKDLTSETWAWAPVQTYQSEPGVVLEEVTFTFHLTQPGQRVDPDSKDHSAWMQAVDCLVSRDVRSIPGWFKRDSDDIECDVYEVCEPEGIFSPEPEAGVASHLCLDLAVQSQGRWAAGEHRRIGTALLERLASRMGAFGFVCELVEARNYVRHQYVTRQKLLRPSLEATAARYVIRFGDGAYNYGPGERNGFDADLSEATRYDSLEEAQQKAATLDDAVILDARTIPGSAEYDPSIQAAALPEAQH